MRRAVLLVLLLAPLAASGPARAADETTQELVNASHTSSVPDSPLQPPLKLRWQANLGHVRSNVVVSEGRVFYVRQPGTGAQLTALNAADGSVIWSQDTQVSGLAFDGGKLFVIGPGDPDGSDTNVRVRALNPADGGTLWERNVTSSYGPASKLTAADGQQLFFVADSGNTVLYAVRQSDGKDLWPPKTLNSGTYSTPALDSDSVYVSMAGDQTYAFRRSDGLQRWHHDSGVSGGGGTSPVVHGGLLYGDEGIIHQTSDGLIVGNWSSRPAWSGDVGVAAAYDRDTGSGEGLRGLGPGYDDTRWTTSLPYASSWLIAGQHAYVGTGFYGADVHAVRLSDGADVWCTHPEMPAGSWTGSSSDEEVHAVAAGDGLLLVSVGYGLAAYESGGPASSCGQDAPSGSSATEPTSPPVTAMSRPALDIRVAKTSLLLGDRTTVQGQLMGMPITGGQEVIAEVDVWPFDGEWVAGARDRASDGGFVTYRLEPKRNVRVRLRLASDPSVTSPEQTVWADFPVDVRRLGAGGPRPRLRVKVFAYPGAQIRKKVVHAYLLRRGWTEYRRVASRRWQRLARRFAAVSLAYPRGTLGRRDRVVICTKERTPDAFGEPSPYDPMCGAKRLPKAVG